MTADDVAQFKVGVATPDDVIGKLGKPLSVMTTSDGSETLIYGSSHARPKAATFVPIVGMFAGGATGETTAITFVFGPDHLLKNATTNTSNIDCSMHVVSMSCGY
ncbi:MAG: hypothetical protein P4M09_07900 [Devosia sp.]|nr:hypothetical protein [Devosia sp.]